MANPNDQGVYVPQSLIWDVEDINEISVDSQEFTELLVRLFQNTTQGNIVLNQKTTGQYLLEEYANSEQYFPNQDAISGSNDYPKTKRQVFRKVINFGALPNTATKSVAHNISLTNTYSFTRIYAATSDQTGMTYLPIPYASPILNQNIAIDIDTTNVNITTGIDRTNYTLCYVVLEYIQY